MDTAHPVMQPMATPGSGCLASQASCRNSWMFSQLLGFGKPRDSGPRVSRHGWLHSGKQTQLHGTSTITICVLPIRIMIFRFQVRVPEGTLKKCNHHTWINSDTWWFKHHSYGWQAMIQPWQLSQATLSVLIHLFVWFWLDDIRNIKISWSVMMKISPNLWMIYDDINDFKSIKIGF